MTEKHEDFFSSLRRYSLHTVLVTLANFGLRLLRVIVFTRLLGPANRGLFQLLFTVPRILVRFANLGLDVGHSILISREKADVAKVFGNVLLCVVGMSIWLIPLTVGLMSFHEMIKGAHAQLASVLHVAVIIIPFLLINSYGKGILIANRQIRDANVLRIMIPVISLVNFLVLWMMTGDSLRSAVYGWLVAYILSSLWIIVRIAAATGYRVGASWDYFRRGLSHGRKGYVSTISDELIRRVDFLLVAFFLGAEPLGYYSVSVATVEMILEVLAAVDMPLIPLRLQMAADEGEAVTPVLTRHILLFVSGVLLAVALLGKMIILVLYGSDFLPSYTPLALLLPGILARSVYNILKVDMWSHDLPGTVSLYSFLALVSNLGLNLLLIPWLGIAGAAISTSAAYLLATLLLVRKFSRTSGVPYTDILFIKRSDLNTLRRYTLDKLKRHHA